MSSFKFLARQDSTPILAKNAFGTGFPTIYQDMALEPTAFETPVPLGELIQWYWLHNELQVNADFSFTAGANSTQFALATSLPFGIGATGWDVLILGVPKIYDFTDTAGLIDNTILAAGSDGSPFYHPTVGKSGSDFYPALFIHGNLNCVDGGNSVEVEFNSNSANLSGAPDGSIPMNILGYPFTLYYKETLAGDGAWTGSFYDVSLLSVFPY